MEQRDGKLIFEIAEYDTLNLLLHQYSKTSPEINEHFKHLRDTTFARVMIYRYPEKRYTEAEYAMMRDLFLDFPPELSKCYKTLPETVEESETIIVDEEDVPLVHDTFSWAAATLVVGNTVVTESAFEMLDIMPITEVDPEDLEDDETMEDYLSITNPGAYQEKRLVLAGLQAQIWKIEIEARNL